MSFMSLFFCFFFFSSRRRHTRSLHDWSSDVCSSDLFSTEAYSNPGLVIPSEILIGLLLSMGIRIAFAGLHMGGQFISYHLGFSAVQVIDPQTQNQIGRASCRERV